MKIDKIYVACCKADFYLTKICIASIRYWNASIPVYLLKDYSQGNFNTSELEQAFTIGIAPMQYKRMGAYGKLFPFIEESNSRVLVLDSDIVWIRDIIAELESFTEDIIIDGHSMDIRDKEIRQWYFNLDNLYKHYNRYQYPGFVFNTGQFVINTAAFTKDDFADAIVWKEDASPIFSNTFLCEDQGLLNYTVAKKIDAGTITYRQHSFYIWGYDAAINKIDIADSNTKNFPALIHWYGLKTGLISGLNGNSILRFYEKRYYSKIKNGIIKRSIIRLLRTIKHPIAYGKAIIKKFL